MAFALTIVVMVVVLGLGWRFLGSYMVAVYEGLRGGSRGWSGRSTVR